MCSRYGVVSHQWQVSGGPNVVAAWNSLPSRTVSKMTLVCERIRNISPSIFLSYRPIVLKIRNSTSSTNEQSGLIVSLYELVRSSRLAHAKKCTLDNKPQRPYILAQRSLKFWSFGIYFYTVSWNQTYATRALVFTLLLANDSFKNRSKITITSKGLDSRKQVGWLLQRPKHVFKIKECCVFLQNYNCNFPFMQRAIENHNATAGSEFDCKNRITNTLIQTQTLQIAFARGDIKRDNCNTNYACSWIFSKEQKQRIFKQFQDKTYVSKDRKNSLLLISTTMKCSAVWMRFRSVQLSSVLNCAVDLTKTCNLGRENLPLSLFILIERSTNEP